MELNNIVINILIGVIVSGFVGLIVYVFTSHSNQTTKRIDSRQEENQLHSEKISQIEKQLSKHEQRLDTLDEFKKDVKDTLGRIEQKMEKLFDAIVDSKIRKDGQ